MREDDTGSIIRKMFVYPNEKYPNIKLEDFDSRLRNGNKQDFLSAGSSMFFLQSMLKYGKKHLLFGKLNVAKLFEALWI